MYTWPELMDVLKEYDRFAEIKPGLWEGVRKDGSWWQRRHKRGVLHGKSVVVAANGDWWEGIYVNGTLVSSSASS